MDHGTHGKFYRDKESLLWHTRDNAVHGESAWKVYQEKGKELVHMRDLDAFGRELEKHKGPVGKTIKIKEFS